MQVTGGQGGHSSVRASLSSVTFGGREAEGFDA